MTWVLDASAALALALGDGDDSLASAVSAPPEISAPACPIRLPDGAVTPAMKPTTGFFMCSLHQ